ncbi:MAG: GNAT family N-acetyltransferase [Pseudomonadota bacterium]
MAGPPPELREITADTVVAVCNLRVAKDQQGLVSPAAHTLAEAAYEPDAWLRAIWLGDRPAGLIAMVDPARCPADRWTEIQRDAAYIWRLMVAEGAQGQGLGSFAIREAIRRAAEWGYASVTLTAAEAPNSAVPFYEKHGFRRTGRILWGDEPEMRRDPAC